MIVEPIEAEEVDGRGPRHSWEASTASWFPVDSACGGSRARSRRSASPGRAVFPSSASAWACHAHRRVRPQRARPGGRQQHGVRQDDRHPVIGLMDDQRCRRQRGGTMRWAHVRVLAPDSLARQAYGVDLIHERHRHRYEFNNQYRKRSTSMDWSRPASQPGRPARRDHRAAPTIPGSWRCSSTRNSSRSRPATLRLFRDFWPCTSAARVPWIAELDVSLEEAQRWRPRSSRWSTTGSRGGRDSSARDQVEHVPCPLR